MKLSEILQSSFEIRKFLYADPRSFVRDYTALSTLLSPWLHSRAAILAHSTMFFYTILTGTDYGPPRLRSVPAAPGTNDNCSGGGPQRGYAGPFNNYHPYRR